MSRGRGVMTAVWEFFVGDDWRIAMGVILALGVTAVVAALDGAAWLVMPVTVPLLLALSLRRPAHRR
jgi:uncharacterized protein (DUF2062 family)